MIESKFRQHDLKIQTLSECCTDEELKSILDRMISNATSLIIAITEFKMKKGW